MNILIVDDEPIIRQWFRHMINSFNNSEMNVAGEAANGEEAIAFIRKNSVDLVVTDIRMPVLDGVGLIKWLHSFDDRISVIILTSHEEFKYVRMALSHGVEDYVLKAEVTENDFYELLCRVQTKFSERKRIHRETMEYKRYFDLEKARQKEKFIGTLIDGKFQELASFSEIAKTYGINITPTGLILLVIRLDYSSNSTGDTIKEDKELLMFAVSNILEEVLTRRKLPCCTYSPGDNRVILLSNTEEVSEIQIKNLYRSVYSDCRQALSRYLAVSVYGSVSSKKINIDKLPERLKKLGEINEWSFFYMDSSLQFLDEWQFLHDSTYLNNFQPMLTEVDSLLEQTREWINQLKNSIETNQIDPGLVRKAVIEKIIILFHDLQNEDRLIEGKNAYECLELLSFMNKDSLLNWCDGAIKTYINKRKDSTVIQSEQILRVIEMIKEKYNTDINLEKMAKMTSMNMSYLSVLFKKETGENYIDYLTNYRINISKKLLRSSKASITEIALSVGYCNSSYFTRVFTRLVGQTPTHYRQKK